MPFYRKTIRLQGFDYGSNGLYFITIDTKDQNHFFGRIVDGGNAEYAEHFVSIANVFHLEPTIIGQKAIDFWKEIPDHYPFVKLDSFIVMPNHIHGILSIEKEGKISISPNTYGPQSRNLGAIIRAYKASVKRYANSSKINFHWHDRYYDEIIRDENQLNEIRNYIVNNPMRWFYKNLEKEKLT